MYKVAAISDLANGVNTGAILPLKVIMSLEKPNEVPVSFLVVDSRLTHAVVSFYNTNKELKDKIAAEDLLYIKNPQLIFTSVEFKTRQYSYNCIKVA